MLDRCLLLPIFSSMVLMGDFSAGSGIIPAFNADALKLSIPHDMCRVELFSPHQPDPDERE